MRSLMKAGVIAPVISTMEKLSASAVTNKVTFSLGLERNELAG